MRDFAACIASLAVCACSLLSACGGTETLTPAPNVKNDSTPQQQATYTVRFAARVGDAPVACGVRFDDVGTTRSSITVHDLRFYVHDVRLVTAAGAEVPLALTRDSKWQGDSVALLDFENGGADCFNGTPEMNDRVTGTAPAGNYTGLRFTLGVPFSLNHQNAVTAAAPLSLTAMAWSWNAGYLFLRAELRTRGQPGGYSIHLGSTGCNGVTSQSPPTQCAQANRPVIRLDAFDVAQRVVVLDLGRLLASSNLDVNEGPSGCQSLPTDPDCAPIFARLGLAFGGAPAGAQSAFFAADR